MQYERLDNCPVCNKEEFKNFLVVPDNSVSKESFVIVQCENCSFKFTNPRPAEEFIGKYYASEEYISHSNTNKGLINKAYQVVRSITVKQKVELINSFVPAKGKILDYGCGTGYFLSACQKNGWQVAGFEPNAAARQHASELLQKEIASENLENFEAGSFDIISLWHVMEHIHQLNETIQQLLALLKPDGFLLVAVPNADSPDAMKYRENWAAYDVPRHLYHFTQTTMQRFLKKHKMEIAKILPMKFDAYYVSLLSEKYIHGNNKYITSLINGYKSNSKAKSSTQDYSSLIYIARKK
ncbi:class I SAM-dependent methyltransferase [Adhaeribacter aquaticus]|uniref:class I SAM-dependent methyltransferase n=1 Tax=Adhaeribacter aquaticus TaxID=299567 RepID=UPI000421BA1B|nr:class I SAM-dependent methyltransferase [Adhaeribacter aquaticus]